MQLFGKLIDHHEAVRLVLENTPRSRVVRVPLAEAQGLALAEELTAKFDSPPFDNSAVDGYALKSAEAEAGRVRAGADLYAAAGLLTGACMQHAFLGHMGWTDRRDDDAAARSFARTVLAGLRGE